VTVLRNGQLIATHEVKGQTENELLSEMTGRDMTKITTVVGNDIKAGISIQGVGIPFVSMRGLKLPSFSHDIELDISRGEIVGLAGLQGNGQSDLLRSLFALYRPVSLAIDGKMELVKNPHMAVLKGFAFVSGDREKEGTFSNRSILENLASVTELVLHIQNVDKECTLTEYGVIMKKSSQLIRALSGGNQQKVVVARWTTAKPKFFLLDDPTKGIDVNARREVHGIIRELADNGTSVMYLSSDEEELVELTRGYKRSRVIVMYRGQIVHTLVGNEITVENIMHYEIPRGKANEDVA
jgi:ABC-type sugar transport system ATPase subunit